MYYLPYNKNLKAFSRKLRNRSTLGEILLWKQLRAGSIDGYTFNRQKPLGNYIVDGPLNPPVGDLPIHSPRLLKVLIGNQNLRKARCVAMMASPTGGSRMGARRSKKRYATGAVEDQKLY